MIIMLQISIHCNLNIDPTPEITEPQYNGEDKNVYYEELLSFNLGVFCLHKESRPPRDKNAHVQQCCLLPDFKLCFAPKFTI